MLSQGLFHVRLGDLFQEQSETASDASALYQGNAIYSSYPAFGAIQLILAVIYITFLTTRTFYYYLLFHIFRPLLQLLVYISI